MSSQATATQPTLAHDPHAGDQMWKLALGALGVVYGDIGTSPLYAIRVSIAQIRGDHGGALQHWQLLGVLSVAVWALVLIVVVKYLTFALRADNEGEGGILALMALLTGGANRGASNGGRRKVIVLGLLAAALLLADGMITPAISVLSAVEGLKEAGGEGMAKFVLPLTVVILIALFLIQKHGTGKLGSWFGPLMTIWFLTIGGLGLVSIIHEPRVLVALSPWYAAELIWREPVQAFYLLAAVVLVVTGAEALYADMGHFGRGPIRLAWYTVVFPCLLLNYFGQVAATLDLTRAADNPFWAIVPGSMKYAMTGVATVATIIASQALISGAYSIAQQAVQLGYCPRLRIVHTSESMMGQIYVPFMNTLLMFACVALVLAFQSSDRLAAMYGLSVTGTMVVTSLLLYRVMREKWGWSYARAVPITVLFLVVDVAFFTSNLTKLEEGGWVALLAGAVVFAVMYDWFEGRSLLARPIYSVNLPLPLFLEDLKREKLLRVPGTAVFMTGRTGVVPMVLMHHIKHNRVLHEKAILLAVQTLPLPRVPAANRLKVTPAGQGIWEVTITYGFMDEPNVPQALRECAAQGLAIEPDLVSYYLGRVALRITRGGPLSRWAKSLFNFLYHNERPATEFFNLPANRVVELGRQLEL